MDAVREWSLWHEKVETEEHRQQLQKLENDETERLSRFGAELSFGTAGMRGVLALGTNRMNVYTVRRATQGLADYVNDVFGSGSVAIGYDSRNQSEEFARETAKVLAANGVKAYIYNRLMPVPMLSFAVRELGCKAGVMITASHNPAEYNGYKVYGGDGCQLTDDDADAVLRRINTHDYFDTIKTVDFDAALADGKIEYIENDVIEAYYEQVLAQRVNPNAPSRKHISIVYTPLNGAGNEPVRRVLEMCGHKKVTVVPEQELPDGDFPTCPYPNPEMAEARALGLELCKEKKPDIFIATDPDADRVGVAFKDKDGEYRSLTGNEAGILMLDYILKCRTKNGSMPKNPVAVRSIVSSALADELAASVGAEMKVVLTGFKYIGEQILLLEQKGEEERFVFGFEESCGYLSGGYVRDKDGVFAAMLLCELTSYYRAHGTTPLKVLEEIYKKYGYYRHRVANIAFPGLDGADRMRAVTDGLRKNPPTELAGFKVVERDDIKTLKHYAADGSVTDIDLPTSDVQCYTLANGARVIVRPSGTEPKMKIYISAKEATAEASDALAAELEKATRAAAGIE